MQAWSVAAQEEGVARTPSHTVTQTADAWSVLHGTPLSYIALNTNVCNYVEDMVRFAECLIGSLVQNGHITLLYWFHCL